MLIFKAHRREYHSTLASKVNKKKKEDSRKELELMKHRVCDGVRVLRVQE